MVGRSLGAEAFGASPMAYLEANQAIQSADPKQVLSAIPALEKIWQQKPEAYFTCMKSAADVLDAAKAAYEARSAIPVLFSNLIEKPLLNMPGSAAANLEEKNNAILHFLNFSEVRDAKVELEKIAKYIGQIRGQIDPGFVPKRIYKNPGLMDASSEEVKKFIEENQSNQAINQYQDSLRRSDTILTFQLIANARRFPANVDFVKSIVVAAHLTDEEQRKIGN